MGRVMNPNPTRYDLTIGERGAMRLPRQAEGMTYHHIIPFNELRLFWNTAVTCDLEPLRETLVPELIRSMRDYVLNQEPPARPEALIQSAMQLLNNIWLGNYVHAAGMAPPGIDDFKAVYTWLPGNLFSGPTIRHEDPGDRFDSFASRCLVEARCTLTFSGGTRPSRRTWARTLPSRTPLTPPAHVPAPVSVGSPTPPAWRWPAWPPIPRRPHMTRRHGDKVTMRDSH